jgi:hypothetical protein
MGSSPLKATAEEMRAAGVSEGTVKLAEKNRKMDNDKWKAGSDAAKKNTGRSLNDLVASRKGLEKGSNEYNKIQNEINAALGSKKRYDVAADSTTKSRKTVTGGTVEKTKAGDTSTKVRTSKSGDRVVTTTKTPDSKSRVVDIDRKKVGEKQPGGGTPVDESKSKKKTKTKTGLSTKTKSDDVTTKTVRKGGVYGDTKKKVKTADTVTKTVTGAKGEVKSSKTRKRLGKGLIKDALRSKKRDSNEPRKKQTSKRSVNKAAKDLGVSADSQAASEKAFYDNARRKKT